MLAKSYPRSLICMKLQINKIQRIYLNFKMVDFKYVNDFKAQIKI